MDYRAQPLETAVFRSSTAIHIDLAGDLDAANVGDLKRLLDDAARQRPYQVVVDLKAMAFIDSAGASTLMSAGRALQACGSTFVLRSPNPTARKVFHLVHLERFALIEE
jgi:anti-sigma B factor antagonist